jgi:beta-glucosidase
LNKTKKILVTGPTANSMKYLNGGWSYNRQGENSDTYAADKSTIPEALQNKLKKENVFYTPGSDFANLMMLKLRKQSRDG